MRQPEAAKLRQAMRELSPVFNPLDVDEVAGMLERRAESLGRPVPSGPARGPVQARRDQGRWVADCPDCRGAWLLAEGQMQVPCGSCLNVNNDSRLRPVEWS
jgi:hypothetical protein